MIQMRENKYDDIRKGVVERSGASEKKSTNSSEKQEKEPKGKEPQEARSAAKGEGPYDEYNSWS